MAFSKTYLAAGVSLFALQTAMAQISPSDTEAQLKKALQQIERLANQVEAQETRIRELEAGRQASQPVASKTPVPAPVQEAAVRVTAAAQPAPPEPAPG